MTALLPVYTATALRAVEVAGLRTGAPLMERAGLAATRLAQQLLGAHPQQRKHRVLVVAGPGNNGGDAVEAAVHLKQGFFNVEVLFLGERARLPADAKKAMAKWDAAGGLLASQLPGGEWDLVIDGLFGIGLSRPVARQHAELIRRINALETTVLSLDVPSGLNSNTGAIMGAAIRATHTLTFIARKPGLLTLDGPDQCGTLYCDDLGLDAPAMRAPDGGLLTDVLLGSLPRRPNNFHKGLAGDAGIIGGAEGMVGAALIAGRAAINSGAGRVLVGLIATGAPVVDPVQPELMMRTPAKVLEEASVLLLGPGMGLDNRAAQALHTAISLNKPMVLDADALNLIAMDAAAGKRLARHKAPVVLTPHPAEAARLLGLATRGIQGDRVAAALQLARRYHSMVVLKGNGSVLADPAGRWWINASGNPGMASAGMGDALAGLITSLMAQGMDAITAAQLGTWLHGAAADELAKDGHGPLGMTASMVIAQLRRTMNRSAAK